MAFRQIASRAGDRKSTRLNSSHVEISYAVFCLKKKKIMAGATLIAEVGILDDRGLLHHQINLFVGMLLPALVLLASGIRTQIFFFFNDTGTTEIYTLSLHDALPISTDTWARCASSPISGGGTSSWRA